MSSRRYLGFGTSKKILGKQPDTNKLKENEENITPTLQIDESKSIKTEIQLQCTTTPVNINKSIYYENSPSPSPDDSDSSSASPQFLTLTQRLGVEVTWRSPKKNDKKNNEMQDTPKLIPSIRKRFVKKIRKQKQAQEQQLQQQQQQQKSGIYKFEEECKKLLLSNQQKAGYDNNNNNDNNNDSSYNNINNNDNNNNNNVDAEHQCNSDNEYKSIHSIRQLSEKRNGKNFFDGNDSFMVKCSQGMEEIYTNTNDNKLGNINSSDMVPKINAGKDNDNIVNNNKLNNCFNKSSYGKEINKSNSFFTDLKSKNNNNNNNNDDLLKNTTECLNNSNLKNILFDDNDSFILQCSQEFDNLVNNNDNNDANNNNNNNNNSNDVSNNNSRSSANHKTSSDKFPDEKPPNLLNRKSITPLKTPLKKSFSFKIKRETIYERHADVLNKSMHENDNDDLLLGSIPIDQLLHDDEPRITKMKRYNSMPSPSSNLQNMSKLSSSMPQNNNKKGLAKINSFNNSSLDNSKESCSSRCTAEEINEKRRIAINRLKTRNNTFSRYKLKT